MVVVRIRVLVVVVVVFHHNNIINLHHHSSDDESLQSPSSCRTNSIEVILKVHRKRSPFQK